MARAYRAAFAVALAGLVGLLVALWAGGAASEKVIPGISDAGRLVRWGLPLSRLLMDLGAAVTLGCLVMAVLLVPLVKGGLSAASEKYLHAASWAATVWAVGAGGTLVLTVADILGVPILTVLQGNELSSYVGQLPQGTGLLIVILLVVVVALLSRTVTSPASAIGVLALAFVALLPPALTGHSAASANHGVAVIGLALHLAAVVPWVGGLAVLTWHALTKGRLLDTAAERFSRLAVWCFAVTGLSGLANTISRIPDPLQLFDSDYGRLILAKVVAFAVLGWFGWQHRERTIPLIRAKKPLAFTRLAVVEAGVMAATMGIAVALSRTAAPAPSLPESNIKALIGYEMPPPVTALRLLTLWRLDLYFLVLVLALGGFYVAGVVRMRRRGDKWPWGRLVAWMVGLLSIVAVTMTGVSTYAPLLFSVHMGEHMTLAMMSPIFLVLGAPMTLALRALKPAKVKGDNGPREWLVILLHSRFIKVVSHPLVATALFIGSTYALYFSPAFEWMMRNHLGHIFMLTHFLVTGFLYYWVIIGVDPAPRKLPYVAKLLLLFVTMPFHAFFGIALMNMGEPLAPGWYDAVHPPWAVSQVHDLQTGGAIAWGFGEIPTFVVLLAIVFQWAMADTRQSRRQDRKADLDGDKELDAYNAKLAGYAKKPDETTSAE